MAKHTAGYEGGGVMKAASKITVERQGLSKSGRKSVIIAASVLGAAVLITAAAFIIAGIAKKKENKPINKGGYTFVPVNPDENIYDDELWLDLDRQCYFEDVSSGISYSIDENLSDVPSYCRQPVETLIKFINAAVAGNADEINGMFSKQYLDAGGEGKTSFTPQKLYDIKFSLISYGDIEEDGAKHESFHFWIEYKIKDNNGTFRNDMGSDATRKEYAVLTIRDESVQIDALVSYNTN